MLAKYLNESDAALKTKRADPALQHESLSEAVQALVGAAFDVGNPKLLPELADALNGDGGAEEPPRRRRRRSEDGRLPAEVRSEAAKRQRQS